MRRLLLPLAALALLAAGCGDDGGDDALSHAEFVRRGDALCTEARRRSPPPPTRQTRQAFAAYFDGVARASADILKQFRDLEPPEADRDEVKGFLTAAEARLADVRRAAAASRRGDGRALAAALTKQRRDAVVYSRAARQIGFKVCGSG